MNEPGARADRDQSILIPRPRDNLLAICLLIGGVFSFIALLAALYTLAAKTSERVRRALSTRLTSQQLWLFHRRQTRHGVLIMPNAALLFALAGVANVCAGIASEILVYLTYYRRFDALALLSVLPATWILQAAALLVETWSVH